MKSMPTIVESVVQQGDSDSIGCCRLSHEVNAFTFCLLKAA
jgi:hypothetical protein